MGSKRSVNGVVMFRERERLFVYYIGRETLPEVILELDEGVEE